RNAGRGWRCSPRFKQSSPSFGIHRQMLTRLFVAILLVLGIAAPSQAQRDVEQRHDVGVITSVQSPIGTLKVDVTLNGEGRVGYQVSRLGKAVLGESQLGFLFTDQPQMLRNF